METPRRRRKDREPASTVTIGRTGFERSASYDTPRLIRALTQLGQPKVLMLPSDALVARIRGEYREMPGLRLTFAQACRLWQMDPPVCEVVLHTLVAEQFLARTTDGAFIALSMPRAHATPLKAALATTDLRLGRTA